MSTAVQRRRPDSKRARQMAREASRQRSKKLFIGAAVGLAALFALAIALTRGESGVSTSIAQTRSVTVSGDELPALESDEAVGAQIPEASGESFAGKPVSIERDGTPKMIVFLAHWCPHCQAEVPVLQAWIDQGGAPQGVEMISVATATDATQGNYPPSKWLEREEWTVPVLVDGADSKVGTAFGVDSYPFFVFVDEEGKVAHRAAGELAIEHIEEILASL